MSTIRIAFAVIMAFFVSSAHAGPVTYFFIEGSNAPEPGLIAAGLTFASPPASQNEFWTTAESTDILTLQILDVVVSAWRRHRRQGRNKSGR